MVSQIASRRLRRLAGQTCASATFRADYPMDGPIPPGEHSGRLLPDGSPERRLPAVDVQTLDLEKARKKYEEERLKRLTADRDPLKFLRIKDLAKQDARFAKMLEDPYINLPGSRAGHPARPAGGPLFDEVEYAVIGGGYGGLLAAGRLREQNIPASEIRIVERAGDVAGTWYWNRYPGAMCDVESYVYMPFVEELGAVPTEKYAHQPELYGHAIKVMQHFGLYENAVFGTLVEELRYDEAANRWAIKTDKGDNFRAKFSIINFGVFSYLKLPEGNPGIQEFQGKMLHTARWDYEYTGGTPLGNMTKLADKRVGIIGTGPTAIQAVPHLAETAQHLTVFQRTPSSVNVRNNFRTTPEFAKQYLSKTGWQRERMWNFGTQNEAPDAAQPDLVDDGWTWYPLVLSIQRFEEKGDLKIMEEIRNRVNSIVKDPQTAEALKPYYKFGCKRPCYHDEFLYTFNRPNVTLVHCPKGVQGFTRTGVIANDTEHGPIDCLVLATGFETSLVISGIVGGDVKSRVQSFDYTVYGKGGVSLTDSWADPGPHTLDGLNSRGFPNLFIMQGPQGCVPCPNSVQGLEFVATHIAAMLGRMRREGLTYLEPSAAAEAEYCAKCYEASGALTEFFASCSPGWLGNEGHFELGKKSYNTGFWDSSLVWDAMMQKRREEGKELEGLEVR